MYEIYTDESNLDYIDGDPVDIDDTWIDSDPMEYDFLGNEIEPGQECHACFGTGLDRDWDSDCLECFGDGVL